MKSSWTRGVDVLSEFTGGPLDVELEPFREGAEVLPPNRRWFSWHP